VHAAHGIPTAQFRTPLKPFQHLAPDQHIITYNMTGATLDSHHFALAISKQHLNRHTMVGDYYAPKLCLKIWYFACSWFFPYFHDHP
jgi:hypothetical protein